MTCRKKCQSETIGDKKKIIERNAELSSGRKQEWFWKPVKKCTWAAHHKMRRMFETSLICRILCQFTIVVFVNLNTSLGKLRLMPLFSMVSRVLLQSSTMSFHYSSTLRPQHSNVSLKPGKALYSGTKQNSTQLQ